MSTAAATVPIARSTSASTPGIVIPEGHTLHTENNSHILISSKDEAFLNPVQEFNRDLSVACIRIWSEEINREKEAKWKQGQERRAKRATTDVAEGKEAKKVKGMCKEFGVVVEMLLLLPCPLTDTFRLVDNASGSSLSVAQAEGHDMEKSSTLQTPEGFTRNIEYRPYKFVLLEALSATGLRSIRYAKEIPLVRFVVANDLSESATAAMRRNVDLNGLGPSPETGEGKVRVNEGDACALMYNHRTEKSRVDVVDLDPYGTAAPFLDAAVQAVTDGGLLCVTCTDLAVLATTNYFEKCFSNYGGVPVKAEYCHEAALRLVFNTISTSASRYGRYIEPLLALSVDFYVRLFVRVHSGAVEVKKAASNTSMYYICSGCQSFFEQKLGRTIEKVNEKTGARSYQFKTQVGPPVPSECSDCGFPLHVSGPMWAGPLHNPEFVSKVLEHVEGNLDKYGTSARMRGMLTVAKEELHTPFYFTPARVAGFFHCTTPSLEEVASALLHAGSDVSRSHACPGSLKTTASRTDIYDVFRCWVKKHPVKMDKISNTSPAARLLAKEPRTEANFTKHPKSVTQSSKVKLVRYQQNPLPNWGPGSKASGIKRKRNGEDNE
ncbi:tRNA methyltransferase [Pisolithus orientalis]|uniref:tRNA methyltransferase n=1 Tax=Pisolithus orientalis TaxID=936130 RepID=UPI0022240262|nr:tRNA methyltransferase [Pisolithus orientalis]KAI6028745.1 tRNA methyltransferase [Pisolithus orientalis]